MSNVFSWLAAPTPVWLTLCLIAACAALGWLFYRTLKRINRHAQSIAHMDEWADLVDDTLRQMERSRRAPPPPPPRTPPAPPPAAPQTPAAQRALADLKSRWQK